MITTYDYTYITFNYIYTHMLSVVLNICYVLLRFDPYLLCCPVRFSGCQLGWRTGDAGHQRNWICSWQICSIHLNPETNHLLFYVVSSTFEQGIAPSAVREFIPTWRVYHNSCSNCSVFSCSRWSLRRIRKIWINEFWAILESGWSIWIYLDIWAISHENPISSIFIHYNPLYIPYFWMRIPYWTEPIVVRLSHTFSPWHWRWNPVPPNDWLGSTQSCQKPRDSSKHSIMNNGFCCDFAVILCFWGLSFVMN